MKISMYSLTVLMFKKKRKHAQMKDKDTTTRCQWESPHLGWKEPEEHVAVKVGVDCQVPGVAENVLHDA